MSSFWSLWITVLTIITIAGVTWLLFANRKTTSKGEDQTTGHNYDGIEEYDNPLPAWWFNMFLASIIFAVLYLAAYPGLGNYKGFLNWTSTGQWQESVDKAEAKLNEKLKEFAGLDFQQLSENPSAVKMGKRLFANNCAVCHGSKATGSFGFPNLADNDWLYGSTGEVIFQSIKQGRQGAMPAWGAAMNEEQLQAVTEYVATMHEGVDSEHAGAKTYNMFCVACHGADGSGNQMMGAPRLNDDIWLYGGDTAQIRYSIQKGRNGLMPAHKDLLSDAKIRLVTAYVLSLQQQQ